MEPEYELDAGERHNALRIKSQGKYDGIMKYVMAYGKVWSKKNKGLKFLPQRQSCILAYFRHKRSGSLAGGNALGTSLRGQTILQSMWHSVVPN